MMHSAEQQCCHSPEFTRFHRDRVVCHCLHVTEMEVRGAVSTGAVETIKAVMECTGAGTGCTACHERIRDLLCERRSRQEQIETSSALEATSAF